MADSIRPIPPTLSAHLELLRQSYGPDDFGDAALGIVLRDHGAGEVLAAVAEVRDILAARG